MLDAWPAAAADAERRVVDLVRAFADDFGGQQKTSGGSKAKGWAFLDLNCGAPGQATLVSVALQSGAVLAAGVDADSGTVARVRGEAWQTLQSSGRYRASPPPRVAVSCCDASNLSPLLSEHRDSGVKYVALGAPASLILPLPP